MAKLPINSCYERCIFRVKRKFVVNNFGVSAYVTVWGLSINSSLRKASLMRYHVFLYTPYVWVVSTNKHAIYQ